MSVKQNVIANFLAQGWTALMGLAFVPFYLRVLGVEAWGLVGFMSMLQAWLVLLDMGLSPTLNREMARFSAGTHSAQSIRDLLRSLELIYGVIAIVIIGLVWVTAPWVATHWLKLATLSAESVTQAIRVMGIVLAARMVELVYSSAIQGLQKQVWLSAAQSLVATLRWGGAALVLAFAGASIEAFFVWQGLVSLLAVAALCRQTHHLLPHGERKARFDPIAVRRIQGFAGGIFAITLLAVLLTQVDKLLLSKLVSLQAFGIYTLASSVAGTLYFLVGPIVTAVSPRLNELVARTDQDALIETYHRASQWLAVSLVPAAMVMTVFPEPLLYVWTGNGELAKHTAPFLTLLALGTLCNGLMHIPYRTQLAFGWTGFAIRVNLVAVVLIIPFIVWAVPRFGAIAAAWAWLALNAGYVIVSIHYMHRRIFPGEKWQWYWNAVIRPLAAALVVTFAMWWLTPLPKSRLLLAATMLVVGSVVMASVMITVPASRAFFLMQFKRWRKGLLWSR